MNKKSNQQVSFTFLKKVKDGEYSRIVNANNLKPLRAPVYRDQTSVEKQYYYSTR